MNCKPGDLALVVKSKVGNEGKIVRCIRLATPVEADRVEWWSGPLWHTDVPLLSLRPATNVRREVCFAPDSALRPIRDPGEDATDETLLWLPVPSRDEVVA